MTQPDKPKKLVILGATGSVGENALDLVCHHPDRFHVVGISGHRNLARLYELASVHRPDFVAITHADPIDSAVMQKFKSLGVALLTGVDAATALVEIDHDLTIAAIVGVAGLPSVFASARRGRQIALANKEAIVCGGALFMQAVRDHGATILPIDSEHNAIFQVLQQHQHVRRLILTASGGPFRGWDIVDMSGITVEQALSHPTWQMGRKISIDSASMMNKGLEVIEAHFLFDMPADQIDVLVHPQSVIHSMVEYVDGSILAQMGSPDMRIPIAHAMAWPERIDTAAQRLDFTALATLSFEKPDLNKFPCLRLARNALECGGIAPTVLNAANEEAVAAFLAGQIGFLAIADVIAACLDAADHQPLRTIEHVFEIDHITRKAARAWIGQRAA